MNGDTGSAARILVVDDNPGIHRDFDLVLCPPRLGIELEAEERGLYGEPDTPVPARPTYVVDHALSGSEGVDCLQRALAKQQPYQLAFVDIRMPGMDGVETIAKIWELDPRVQAVICTAYADYSWEELARRLGQSDQLLVLKKPFDNLEVTLLASTLTEKWLLGRQAELKLEEMERLVAQRTQQVLSLQPHRASTASGEPTGRPLADTSSSATDLPLLLVLSSDDAVRSTLRHSLTADYRILEAANGEAGLNLAQENIPDLVLAEMDSPGVDGLDFCRRLKATELGSHIPVLLLADAGAGDREFQAVQAGADGQLTRPLSLPLFKRQAEQLLASRRSLVEKLGSETAPYRRHFARNQVEAQFLRRLVNTVDRHLADYEFDVEALAQKLALSRRQLFRKLKAVTGVTPNLFIRNLRLKRAAQLLKDSQLTITEVTYAVGFADLKHFRTVFREQFGLAPVEYAAKVRGRIPPAST